MRGKNLLDCIIRGGTVVDGTGAPGVRADVGILGGRVVSIGEVKEAARRTLDAGGRVVAPGFIDVHTHYDAQVMWDASITPSSLHGVTTILGGNCGFTVAPVDASSSDYVMRMLACVEGMPVESLEACLDFRWRSFGEWLARLEGRLALNAGFSVGHSTIRRLVMGEDCRRPADDAQVAAMASLVAASVEAGALGFSSSWGSAHADHLGNPVPSRHAEADELVRLSRVLRAYPGTSLEFIPGGTRAFDAAQVKVMTDMSAAAGRPLNWNLVSVGTGTDEASIWNRLGASDDAARQGATVRGLALPIPMQFRLNLLTAISYNAIPLWREILALPMEQRLRALAEPATRTRMAEAIVSAGKQEGLSMRFGDMTVGSVTAPELKHLEERKLSDLAAEKNCTPLDAFLDVAIADSLRACFTTPPGGDDDASWRLRARIWDDPRVLVGGSDAGAHLDMTNGFAFFTDFVGPIVRERGLISLEQAVHKLTEQPARFFGLRDRGCVAPGYFADLVVFDPATVRTGKTTLRNDMPGGQSRLFSGAIGIDRVLVNGVEVVAAGKPTGATPGTVLRSGRDTA